VLGSADVRLSDDVLDAIDKLVPPGRTLNAADAGWESPSLRRSARRRPRR
jgi:allantoicase